jgi:hypothetical protein
MPQKNLFSLLLFQSSWQRCSKIPANVIRKRLQRAIFKETFSQGVGIAQSVQQWAMD